MVTIKRAVSLGLALDATSLRREVSAVARSLRAAEDPFKSLSNQMRILEDDALQSADSLEKFEFASKKLELAFYKKQEAIKKTNEEWYRYTAAGKAAAAEEARLAKIVEDVVAIEAKHVSELDKTIQRQERLREAEREGLISKKEMIALIQAEEDALFAASPEAKKLAKEIEAQAREDERAAEAKKKLIAGLEAAGNPTRVFRNAVAELNSMQAKGEITTAAAAAEYERLRKVYDDTTGATKRRADQEKVLQEYERARIAQVERGRGVLAQQLTAEQKIEQQYREELAALQALLLEEQARGNGAGVSSVQGGIDQLTTDRDNALLNEQNRYRREGVQYLKQFYTSQQRVTAQLQEARSMWGRMAITTDEYNQVQRKIIRDNSAVTAGFKQFKAAALNFVGPLILIQQSLEGARASLVAFADFEKAKARFRVFTGTVENANAILGELRTIAAGSPITFSGGQKAVATMLQFGVATDDVIKRLKQLGEITAGDNDRLQSISLAFAQVQAAGRLMGQELIQLVNAGFNPLQEISRETGETLPELKKRMEEGRISFEEVAAAFDQATQSGGRFNGLLEEVAGTFAGKLEIAKSKVEELQIAFGEFLSRSIQLENLTDSVSLLTDSFEALNLVLGQVGKSGEEASFGLFSIGKAIKDANTRSAASRLSGVFDGLGVAVNYYQGDLEAALGSLEELDRKTFGILSSVLSLTVTNVEELRAMKKAYQEIDEIKRKVERGEDITSTERAALDDRLKKERELKRVDQEKYDLLKQRLDKEIEQTKILREQNRLRLEFDDSVGKGYLTDEEIAKNEVIRKQLEEFDKLEKERIANITRIEESLDKQIQKYQDSINELKTGIDANALGILGSSLNEDDQKAFQELINKAETLSDIVDGIDLLGLQIPQANIDAYNELLAIKKKVEDADKSRKINDDYDASLKKTQEEVLLLKEKASVGERQARINQLIRQGIDGPRAVALELQEQIKLNETRKAAFEKDLKAAKDKNTLINEELMLGIEIARINDLRRKGELDVAQATSIVQQQIKQDFDEQVSNLALEAKYLQEINTLGEEQARINQLVRENGFDPAEAQRVTELEKARDIEKEIAKIREDANKLIEQDAKGPFADAVDELAKLQAQFANGWINQNLFDQERQRVLDQAVADQNGDINGARAPRAIQKDSAEAFALSSDAVVNQVKEQIKIARKQQIQAELNAKANTEATKILNEIKQKPGVLPI